MSDKRAALLIADYAAEELKASNFRNLYQEVSDLMLPRENSITVRQTPGHDKSVPILDPVAMLDLEDMVSGLSAAFFPAGQQAFAITTKNRDIAELDEVKLWLAKATQTTHDELFESNFMLQLNETLSPIVGFGTGNLFSEWDNESLKLNFKAWDVSRYVFKQNSKGQVDVVYIKHQFTAKQAFQEWGATAGKDVIKAVENLETESEIFEFIWVVRKRISRSTNLVNGLNMPWENVVVNVSEEKVIKEGGFRTFPCAIARWKKDATEKYGRGQGTQVLATVKLLQRAMKDWIDLANKYANPPLEVEDTVPGKIKTFPSAINRVPRIGSIRGIGSDVLGNFPVTDQSLDRLHAIIHRSFFVDVFAPLAEIGGEARMTNAEIFERAKTAMKKLSMPVYRLEQELFTPTITRCVLLLIKNGRIEEPPRVLGGQPMGIEYVGELALALRDQQARAFGRFTQTLVALEPLFPNVKDMISMERALPDVAINEGLKIEHLSTKAELLAKAQARAQAEQEQRLLQAAEVAGQTYNQTTASPDAGSPAEKVMNG